MKPLLTRLAAVLCLVMAALIAVPPAQAQQREDIPMQRLEGDLREILMRAARAQGLRIGDETRVQVSTRDCPTDCNNNVLGGKCYCGMTRGSCPEGSDRTRYPADSNRACSINPTTAAITGPGIPPQTFLRP
jgi:hypothetical protein